MDARKALFRAKLREQKQDKRIVSPLVRYNENDQPVCRVCNVTLKSESLWIAHQASRKHHEAIQNFKAAAARANANVTSDVSKNYEKGGSYHHGTNILEKGTSAKLSTVRTTESSSASTSNKQLKRTLTEAVFDENTSTNQAKRILPEGFFDEAPSEIQSSNHSMKSLGSEIKKTKGTLPEGFIDSKERNPVEPSAQVTNSSEKFDASESKHLKGSLPKGFFDNEDADLRARGIEPVKVDINDAYKEFEKEIQEDLQGVDDRLEEEEIDAAEIRQEYESLEQKQYRERVEMVKKRLVEVRTTRLEKGRQRPDFMGHESSDESSSDSDEEENFTVDWRAKHL